MKTFDELTALAQSFMGHLVAGEFTAAADLFEPAFGQLLPAPKLQEIWQQLNTQVGPIQRMLGLQTSDANGQQSVAISFQFEKAAISAQFIFNAEGQVTRLNFQLMQGDLPYNPPAYVRPDAFHEVEVTVGSGDWALPGTLTMPNGSGPFPALVLVHGSGPNNRDETIGPNRPFRDLAWGLASLGVAVLRYDKRTFAHRMLFTPELAAHFTVQEETVDDALLAAQLLRQTPGIDPQRVFVLGHSLGGMLIPRIGQQDPQLAGLIVMAGAAIPMEDAILNQYTYLYSLNGGPTPDQVKELEALKLKVAAVKADDLSLSTPHESLPLGVYPAYWLNMRGYRPAEVARSLDMPLLVLQAGRDYQVTAADDYALWQAALADRPNAALKLYPSLYHLFIPGEGPSTPQEYMVEGHIPAEVIGDMASWITK
jgi:dienelactone hydrolase